MKLELINLINKHKFSLYNVRVLHNLSTDKRVSNICKDVIDLVVDIPDMSTSKALIFLGDDTFFFSEDTKAYCDEDVLLFLSCVHNNLERVLQSEIDGRVERVGELFMGLEDLDEDSQEAEDQVMAIERVRLSIPLHEERLLELQNLMAHYFGDDQDMDPSSDNNPANQFDLSKAGIA